MGRVRGMAAALQYGHALYMHKPTHVDLLGSKHALKPRAGRARTFCVQVIRMQAPQPSLPARPDCAMGLLRGIATAFQYGQELRLR